MKILEAFDIRNFTDTLTPSHKGKGFYVCPSCEGNTLSVNQKTGEYSCFSNGQCSPDQIREAIRPLKSVIDEAKAKQREAEDRATQWQKPVRPASRPVYFQYPAENGDKLVQVKRTDLGDGKKEIRQAWWNGEKWQSFDMPDEVKAKVNLYRINDPINQDAIATGKPLFYVEGEPVTDLLLSMGIAATTNIGGSGKWKAYGGVTADVPNLIQGLVDAKPSLYVSALDGANVVLCPDRDRSGIKHCLEISQDVKAQWLYADPTNPEWDRWETGKGYDLKDWVEDIADPDLAKQLILESIETQRIYAPETELSNLVPINSQSIPPQDLDAESFIIGQFLLDKNRVGGALGSLVSPDHFYRPLNREICSAVLELFHELEPIDVLSVHQRLTRKGFGDKISQKNLQECRDRAEQFADNDLAFQCKVVKDKYILRTGQALGREFSKLFTEESKDVKKLVAIAQQKFVDFQTLQSSGGEFLNVGDILERHSTEIQSKKEANPEVELRRTLRSGIRELDGIGQVAQKSIVGIYGRPSNGKTTLTAQWAQQVAIDYPDQSVIYLSLESSKEELAFKGAAMNTGLDGDMFRYNDFPSDSDRQTFKDLIGAYKQTNLYIYDNAESVDSLCSRIRAFRVEKGAISAIFIDYIQLLKPEKRTYDETKDVNECLRQLRNLRKELDVSIFYLVQLNREAEKRSDARPTPADAKQSGQIEQDCDDIIYTYLDEKYNPNSPNKGLIEFGFLKRRNNLSGGKCTSAFNGRHSRVGNPKSILEVYAPQQPQQLQTTPQYDPNLDEWDEI